MPSAPSPGQRVRLTIESLAYRGAGVARLEGCVVFVPGTVAGEVVDARITRLRKRFAEAELVAVEQPSPWRQPSDCQVPGFPELRVPGCVYAHLKPEEELRVKHRQLTDFLVRPGFCDPDVILPVRPSPAVLHYRNKIVLHVGRDAAGAVLGYVTEDNRSIVDLPACPLADDSINRLLGEIRDAPDFAARLSAHAALTLRCSDQDGAVAWWDRPEPGAAPLHAATPMGLLTVPRAAFYQVNQAVALDLLDQVSQWMRQIGPRNVLDLYCGIGLFSLAASFLGIERVIGSDRNASAVAAARENAAGLTLRARFLATDAGSVARTHLSKLTPAETLVLLDPPRSGLDKAVCAALCANKPANLIYIACAPDMLVRDLGILRTAGYAVRAVQPFDMFPRTAAFETAAWLSREG